MSFYVLLVVFLDNDEDDWVMVMASRRGIKTVSVACWSSLRLDAEDFNQGVLIFNASSVDP
jgi:hypothetical protein